MTTVESLPEHGRTREVLVLTLEGDVFRQLEAGCAAMEQDPLGPDTTSAAALLREVMYATTEQGEQVNEACVHARRKMVFLESIRLAPMYPRAAEMVMVLAGARTDTAFSRRVGGARGGHGVEDRHSHRDT
jgi:hypothetical protein